MPERRVIYCYLTIVTALWFEHCLHAHTAHVFDVWNQCRLTFIYMNCKYMCSKAIENIFKNRLEPIDTMRCGGVVVEHDSCAEQVLAVFEFRAAKLHSQSPEFNLSQRKLRKKNTPYGVNA